MLDDQNYVQNIDPEDALGLAAAQWEQLEHQFDIPELSEPKNIVFAGMGGSALAALISVTWPGYKVPFEVIRDYQLPRYVDSDTLAVISSYSGNTEEAVSCLEDALHKGAQTVVVDGGGRLMDLAREKGLLNVELPKASQPRYAVMYALKALVVLLERAGQVSEESAEAALHEAAEFLKESITAWVPGVATADNTAKQLAQEMIGSSPVIYAGPVLAPAAYKWKISFNENAKNIAWWGQYPEFNHNEFMGWTSHPVNKPYEVIDLRSSFDHERIQRRFELSDRLLSGKRPKAHVVNAQGDTMLQQLLWTIVYGDFVSLYTAILNGVNPTPVHLIEKFKKELNTQTSQQ
ncbi:MAG: bifunctional phosphoglucose/phosphomannose isomerase [Patescibacteria group bacterium]